MKDEELLINLLETNGFSLIGMGAFSTIWNKHNEHDKVFKVFSNRDEGYINFLKYVKFNSKNPHLPKIHGNIVKLFMESYYGIYIEKLSSIYGEFNKDFIFIKDICVNEYNEHIEMCFYKKYKTFIDTIYDLKKNTNKFRIDFHYGNVMMRGNIPVIIDPYAGFIKT